VRDDVNANDGGWWSAISPYLDQALEMSPGERTAWLQSMRESDPARASQLEAILAQHQQLAREGFLERSPSVAAASDTLIGTLVGVYTLVRPIGEGGMGTVWLAERRDGEIQQQVAVKFLGPGQRPAWRERFLRERQLLASLSHASIVHVIDAGHTSDGRPYLVMEYVDGRPIDVYSATLPLADRLRLFLGVCDAVSHAHQRLIVHRDLKPTNILVDAAGRPKLLDFGIARLINDTDSLTLTAERLLTPQYASPEQLQGTPQTTATDIYSLGAVLYTLLTGRTPHEGDRRATRAADVDVVPPSRRQPDLPVDVDYVIRKAMREEPNDRYGSVDAFAADVRALLESRPVAARAGDRWYRARTFVRRNRLQLTAAGMVLASLSGGLYVANRQRLIAQERFQQVRSIANQFIALDEELRSVPGTTRARSRIVSESLNYLAALAPEAGGDTELALDIGSAYLQVARVQGVPFVSNLGRFSAAEESLRHADEFVDAVLTADPDNRKALLASAQIAHDRMALVGMQNRLEDGLEQARLAGGRLERLLRHQPLTPAEINAATQIYSNVAVAYQNNNRFEEANRYSKRAIEISAGVDAARQRRASAFGTFALGLRRVGDMSGALQASQQSRRLLEALAADGDQAFNLTTALWREGLILGEDNAPNLNRPADALSAFRRALAIVEDQAAQDAADYRSRARIAILSREIGNILLHSDPVQALSVYDHALARLHEATNNAQTPREESDLLAYSSYAARAAGNAPDAKRRIDRSFDLLRKTEQYPADVIEPDTEPYHAVRALADHQAATGHPEPALEIYQQLLAKVVNWKPNPEHDLRDAATMSQLWSESARLLRQLGRPAEASVFDARRRELWTAWEHAHPDNEFVRGQLAAAG